MILLVTNLLLMTILITLNKGITGLIITEKNINVMLQMLML